MPKQVRHDKNVILNLFQNPILKFDIHWHLDFEIWIYHRRRNELHG